MSTIKVDTLNEKSTNGDIAIIPTGSGKLVLDGLTWPHADGSANQLLKSNGSGVLSFVDAPASAGWAFVSGATASGTVLHRCFRFKISHRCNGRSLANG